ncbi:SWIB/MDM2 domain [Dillenia turbinata]|uniref:SWIB/MDM2 domain n=1 Tax=Dillenia turbinata TaxID=194707 RepID=A0AAN8Z296_9MAGN
MSGFRVLRQTRVLCEAAKSAARCSTSAKAASSVGLKVKAPRSGSPTAGIVKLTPVSPAMQEFLGVSEASRTDAVKKVWDYIKLHNLQDRADKRKIHCDEKLKTIFDGKDHIGMLEIGKLLNGHFLKTN